MKRVSKSKSMKGVTPNHLALYQKIASRSDDIIECLFQLMESRNENIRLGAAKVLANKILPDKKAVEHTGEDGGPIKITVIGDYLSKPGLAHATPTGGTEGPDKVQGTSLA